MGKTFYNLSLEDLCDLMCGGVEPDEFGTGNLEENVPRGTLEQEVQDGHNDQPCK